MGGRSLSERSCSAEVVDLEEGDHHVRVSGIPENMKQVKPGFTLGFGMGIKDTPPLGVVRNDLFTQQIMHDFCPFVCTLALVNPGPTAISQSPPAHARKYQAGTHGRSRVPNAATRLVPEHLIGRWIMRPGVSSARRNLRGGNYNSAKFWGRVLRSIIERYRDRDIPNYTCRDAAFAIPPLYRPDGGLVLDAPRVTLTRLWHNPDCCVGERRPFVPTEPKTDLRPPRQWHTDARRAHHGRSCDMRASPRPILPPSGRPAGKPGGRFPILASHAAAGFPRRLSDPRECAKLLLYRSQQARQAAGVLQKGAGR